MSVLEKAASWLVEGEARGVRLGAMDKGVLQPNVSLCGQASGEARRVMNRRSSGCKVQGILGFAERSGESEELCRCTGGSDAR